MRVKILTLRYCPLLCGFDETALVEFLRDKEVLSFREHFYMVNEVPHFTCILTYQMPALASEAPAPRSTAAPGGRQCPAGDGRRQPRGDALPALDERERAIFNTLREWRAQTARAEGVPPYVVFTNRQLVQIIRRGPASPTALAGIDGVGPGKIKRYGREILARLNGTAAARKPPAAAATDCEPQTAAAPASDAEAAAEPEGEAETIPAVAEATA